MTGRLVAPVAFLLAAWAFCSPGLAQSPRDESVNAFFKAFRHHLALTSAGVDECANRFPARKEAYLAAYRRARDENLDVFVKAESSDDFAETLLAERVRASKEAGKVMVEYCGDLPGSIDVLARHATRLRSLLTYP